MAVPIEVVISALRSSKGIVSLAAKNLGISRTALHRRIQRNKSLQEIKQEARETIIDVCEGQLFKAANDGQQWAIKYCLSNLGKHRGYYEKSQVEMTEPDIINISVKTPQTKANLKKWLDETE